MKFKKSLLTFSTVFIITFNALAYTMYPTVQGTSFRDYSKPGLTVDGNNMFPTVPGTSFRDYSKPGWKVDGDNMYPTVPGTSFRDYSKSGWRIGN
jgi:hypothetical protein